jgi:hypothetical protein
LAVVVVVVPGAHRALPALVVGVVVVVVVVLEEQGLTFRHPSRVVLPPEEVGGQLVTLDQLELVNQLEPAVAVAVLAAVAGARELFQNLDWQQAVGVAAVEFFREPVGVAVRGGLVPVVPAAQATLLVVQHHHQASQEAAAAVDGAHLVATHLTQWGLITIVVVLVVARSHSMATQ